MQQIFNQTDGLCNRVSTLASMEYSFKIYSVSEDSYTRASTNESGGHVFKGRIEDCSSGKPFHSFTLQTLKDLRLAQIKFLGQIL